MTTMSGEISLFQQLNHSRLDKIRTAALTVARLVVELPFRLSGKCMPSYRFDDEDGSVSPEPLLK